MAWIESHQDLEKNGKLLQLASNLGINRYQAIGHLHSLWWWALDNAEDGNLKRFCNAVIAKACGWAEYITNEIDISRTNDVTSRDKTSDDFIKALIECGFLDRKDEGIWIHNWTVYTQRFFKSMKQNNRQKELAKNRVKKYRENLKKCNANVTLMKRSVTVPTKPNLTKPNHIKSTNDHFETFWRAYPRKVGKGAAEKAWEKVDPRLLPKILDAVGWQTKSSEWTKEDGKFIPHPTTWLNQRRWEDEIRGRDNGPRSFFDKVLGQKSERIREEPSMGGLSTL